MRPPSAQKITQAFADEWNEAARVLLDQVLSIARCYGCSESFEEYLRSSGGFWKFIYPLAGWIEDRWIRQRIGVAFALHCYGIKILDDIIDEDRPFTAVELLVGHQFCDQAAAQISLLGLSHVFWGQYLSFWPKIWAHLQREPVEKLGSLQAWKESAHTKCGMILEFYATVAVLVSGKPIDLERVKSAMSAMGVIYTLLDDIRDAANSLEAHSNVWVLLKTSGCTIDDLEGLLIEQSRIVEVSMSFAPSVFPLHLPCEDAIAYCKEEIRIIRANATRAHESAE